MENIYIVTGATGFVGNNTVREILNRGGKVRAFVRSEEKAKKALSGLDVELYYGDLLDKASLEKLFEGDHCFTVIHTAAVVSIGDKKKDKYMPQTNIDGTRNILEVCRGKNIKRFVYVSSVHAITEQPNNGLITEIDCFVPESVVGKYAKTKAAATELVMDFVRAGLDAVVVHPSGIIGPYDYSDTHLTQMVLDYYNGRIPASVKGGYDFVDVRDVAWGILAAAEHGEKGGCYLLTGGYHTIKELLAEVCTNLHKKPLKVTMPMWVARFSLPFLGAYFKVRGLEPLYTGYSLYTLRSNANFSCEKAKSQLQYCPRSLSETIRDTVAFLVKEGKIKLPQDKTAKE